METKIIIARKAIYLSICLQNYLAWKKWVESHYCPVIEGKEAATKYFYQYNHQVWIRELRQPIQEAIKACEMGIKLLHHCEGANDRLLDELTELISRHSLLISSFKRIYSRENFN